MDQTVHKPIPAATLIVMRDGDVAPQFLMVRRAMTMAFAPGAYVFPGGRVDEDDLYLGRIHGPALEPADAAARVAAIRETLEETGLAVAMEGLADGPAVEALRSRLLGGDPFSAALEELGAALDLASLDPYSRWCPAHRVERIFDTRFYIAHTRGHAGEADEIVVNAEENSHALWIAAKEIIAMADRAEARVIFPTRATLARLAQYRCRNDIGADITAFPPAMIEPVLDDSGEEKVLRIPEGLGYPLTSVVYRQPLS